MSQSLFLQAQLKNTLGSTWIGSFTPMTVLDSAFCPGLLANHEQTHRALFTTRTRNASIWKTTT